MDIRSRFFSAGVVAGLTCALLTAGSVAVALADDSGSLSGVVTNSMSGHPIEGATISIYAAGRYLQMRLMTSRSGHYAVVGLQPGAYSAFFTKDGMDEVEGQFEICPGAQTTMSASLSSWCSAGCFGHPASTISPTSTTTVVLDRSWGMASSHCR